MELVYSMPNRTPSVRVPFKRSGVLPQLGLAVSGFHGSNARQCSPTSTFRDITQSVKNASNFCLVGLLAMAYKPHSTLTRCQKRRAKMTKNLHLW